MNRNSKTISFLFPKLTPRFLLRMLLIGIGAYVFFGHICIPMRVQGRSMEPTYHDSSFNFCWRPAFIFRDPKRHDVVLVRFAGRRVMLLKRVAALEGEWLEFRHGRLFINGQKLDEPYVHYPSNWNLKPRLIEKGAVYVLGDNRSVPVGNHYFGQTSIKRIEGVPLW